MAMSLLVSGSLVLATGGLFHVLENKRPLEEINRTKASEIRYRCCRPFSIDGCWIDGLASRRICQNMADKQCPIV